MDTAKPLNPPKNDDAADDLIEELARLMANDAQSGTAGAKPPAAATDRQPAPKSEMSGAQSQGFSDSASGQVAFDAPSSPAVTKTNEPAFDMKGFDIGAPKAEVTNLTSAPTNEQTGAQTNAETSSKPPVSLQSPKTPIADFDFGFGVGPENGTPQNSKNTTSPAPLTSAPAVQPGSDPIADLINAAVSKHTLPDIAPTPVSQKATPQQVAPPRVAPQQTAPQQAAPPRVAPQQTAPSPSKSHSVTHSPLGRGPVRTDSGSKDKFKSPPVFGLSGKPSLTPNTSPKASGGSMALDEIESLIGNSVQVDTPVGAPADFNAQQAVENGARTSPALAKAPMAANIAPQSQPSSNAPSANSKGVKGSILQAMSNSGAAAKLKTFAPPTPGSSSRNVNVSNEFTDAIADADEEMQLAAGRASFEGQQSGGLSRYVVPVLGVLFIGAVGFGLYTLFNPGAGEGTAPILRADGSPTRQAPDVVEPGTQSVVLNAIDGGTPVAEGEQLVSRDQSAEINGSAIRQVETLDTSETGLANRRVRTVTVRPDGTIISGADAVAGGEVLNVAQPDLPELPADSINSELSATTVASLPQNPAVGLNVALESIATPNPTEAPTPRPRLANRDALAAVIVNNQAATSTVPQTTPGAVDLVSAAPAVPTTPVVNAAPASNSLSQPVLNPGAFVQLASQRDEGVANQTAITLQSRFSSSLQGGSLLVRRVDLGTRGIYYRVQLPTSTLAQANSICESIKGAGGDCFVRNS